MSSSDWSTAENDAIVATYFAMLHDDLAGRVYNKAEQNRILQTQLGRSRGSIEFKNHNISAVVMSMGLPVLRGYVPRSNFQMSLAEAVFRWVAAHPDWDRPFLGRMVAGLAEPSPLFVGVAPTLRNHPPTEEVVQAEQVARRFDIAGRDERNRALGRAGEERVFQHEQARLRQAGREDLARRVRWVSREDGDGAGYDIESFTAEGRPRLIEVKTTNGWERTPFYISRNELDVASERRDEWHLFRLYDFIRGARAFEIRPPLEAHVSLIATGYEARFS